MSTYTEKLRAEFAAMTPTARAELRRTLYNRMGAARSADVEDWCFEQIAILDELGAEKLGPAPMTPAELEQEDKENADYCRAAGL